MWDIPECCPSEEKLIHEYTEQQKSISAINKTLSDEEGKRKEKGVHSCNNTALLKGLFIVAEASPSDYRVLFFFFR